MSHYRGRDDEGAYAILYALLVVILIGMASIVVDLGSLRADKRDSRNAADVASLAAVADLGTGPWSPRAACNAAWTYVWTSLDITPPPTDKNPCNGYQPSYSTCPSAPIEVTSTAYEGVIVLFTWPIPSSSTLLSDPDGLTTGTRSYNKDFDGSAAGCDRFGVSLDRTRVFGLAAALGVSSGNSTATSVARKTTNPGSDEFTYPLVVLDEHVCRALGVGGTGANLLVTNAGTAYPNVAGRIAVDSDGTVSCQGQGASILEVNGQTFIQTQDAINASSDPLLKGAIEVFGPSGLPAKTTAAGTSVPCTPTTGVLPTNTPCVGQTVARTKRVTRFPFDLAFKTAVSQLGSELGAVTSTTGGWTVLTGDACAQDFDGNALPGPRYYVNCPDESANFKLTNIWSFPSGSTVLVNGDLVLGNGGCFATNVEPAWSVTDLCAGVFQPAATALAGTGVVQVRGSVDAQGDGDLILPGTFLNLVGRTGLTNPAITGTSFANILWTAPYYADKAAAKSACEAAATGLPAPQCFRNLAYWTETQALNTIQGGASLVLEGTFFLGEAPLKVGGNGAIAVTKSQFVARTITSGGNKTLTFTPDPERTTGVPTFGVTLIR